MATGWEVRVRPDISVEGNNIIMYRGAERWRPIEGKKYKLEGETLNKTKSK